MIDVRDLFFRYPGASDDALHGVALQIHEGSIVAVMGSNGSGKSTLARCLSGLGRPTGGTVEVDGLRADESASLKDIHRRVGMIFQDPNLQMTSSNVEREIAFGLENFGVDRGEMRGRVEEVLSRFRLLHCRSMPLGHLSAGEKQRVAIASVVVLRPRYLILDEATSLLSPLSRRELIDFVRRYRDESGAAVLLMTQFPSESEIADRLIVLHRGRVLAEGDPSGVFDRDGARLRGCGVPVPLRTKIQLPT